MISITCLGKRGQCDPYGIFSKRTTALSLRSLSVRNPVPSALFLLTAFGRGAGQQLRAQDATPGCLFAGGVIVILEAQGVRCFALFPLYRLARSSQTTLLAVVVD